MIQEYMLKNVSDKDSISKYQNKDVEKFFFSLNNGKSIIVRFKCEGENEKSARILSEVHDDITSRFKVLTLESECSKYFNRRLYPLINEFECLLRKVLFIFGALNDDGDSLTRIESIESLDYGAIISMLFIDDSFMSQLKDDIKKRNKEHFSKKDIVDFLQSTSEVTLWDRLVGEKQAPTLRMKFGLVRDYRNDIRTLFITINSELKEVIEKIEVKEHNKKEKKKVNQLLDDALSAQEKINEIYRPIMDEIQKETNLYPDIFTITKICSDLEQQLKPIEEFYNSSPVREMIQEQTKVLSELKEISPALKQLNNIIKNNSPILNFSSTELKSEDKDFS